MPLSQQDAFEATSLRQKTFRKVVSMPLSQQDAFEVYLFKKKYRE